MQSEEEHTVCYTLEICSLSFAADMISRTLGPEFGGAIGLMYYMSNLIGAGMLKSVNGSDSHPLSFSACAVDIWHTDRVRDRNRQQLVLHNALRKHSTVCNQRIVPYWRRCDYTPCNACDKAGLTES